MKLYDALSKERARIVPPLVIFVLVFFFLQQILTNFTPILDGEIFPGLTWAYLYAFAQFFVVVILTTFYRSRMTGIEKRYGTDKTVAQPASGPPSKSDPGSESGDTK